MSERLEDEMLVIYCKALYKSTYLYLLLRDIRTTGLSFFLFRGGTLPSHASLSPASQAGPMRNPREGTSVVLRDTISKLMVCVVCSCCATFQSINQSINQSEKD